MTNKLSPQLLARVTIPAAGYVHNIWHTPDGQYAVTTEETANKTVKVWDISDLQNISLVGNYLAPSNLAHNAQVFGDTVYISHYESGVRVVDISNPTAPVEIAGFDTYSGETSNYNGCWGAFPYTSNGLVYASNMDGHLFVLDLDEIVVTDSMWIDSVQTVANSHVRLNVHLKNDLPVSQIKIPVSYGGDNNLELDSASTAGLRTEYFESVSTVADDPANDRIAFSLRNSVSGSQPDLPPGKGPVLSLYFTVPPGVDGDPDTISLAPVGVHLPSVSNQCIAYVPDTSSGLVTLSKSLCCIDTRGNVNGDDGDQVNVTDLSYLADFLFRGGPQPPCRAEGNVNGDPFEDITVSDLSFLVDFLFRGGSMPSSCP
jgi:hypothetical protein